MSLYPATPGVLGIAPGDQQDEALQRYFDEVFRAGPLRAPTAFPSNAIDDAPIDVSNAASVPLDIGRPVPDLKDRRGILQRLQDRPGGREALLAFGAGMLSEPNFFQGLSKGALAYQSTINAERDRMSPQLTSDGQFTYRRNPHTGEFDFRETAAGLRARDLAKAKLDSSETNTRYRADRSYDGKVYGVDRQYDFKGQELGYRDRWEKDRNATRIRSAEIAGQFGMDRARLQTATQAGKPPPVGALKEFDEHESKANQADGILELGGNLMDDIASGALDLGWAGNARARFSQATGIGSNDNTRAYARWQQFQQMLVNGILLDAKGTQAEGDAIRAKIQTAVSAGDTEGAKREIANALQMVENGRNYSMSRAADISRQYGIDTSSTAVMRDRPHPSPSVTAAPSRAGGAPSGWGRAKVRN